MTRIVDVCGKRIVGRAEYEALACQRLGDEQLFFSMKKLDFFISCPQTSKEGKARMSIKATAVVKKETKVDPNKPQDKVHYASLSVLNGDGKGCGLPRYLGEFRDVAVLLKREAGVTHEQLHERFAAYERGEEISFPLTLESDEAIKNLGFDPTGAADS
jgi:hypothetical protein